MKFLRILALALIFPLFECVENEEPGIEEVFWVYSYPISCGGSEPAKPCLGISIADEFDFNWQALERIPFEIEGFTFKPYYLQKIKVLKYNEPNTNKIRRKLVRILSEERDYYDLLEGGWRIKRFMGEDLPNPNFPNGQTVSVLPGIRMAVSSDGCYRINLEIQKVGPNKILSFGSALTTLIACNPEERINPFPGLSKNFKREGKILTFYSEEEGEVAIWEKLD